MPRDYSRDLEDYVDVAERIAAFKTAHPEGSLQSEVIRWPEEGFAGIAVKAYAYRSPDDQRPGIGHAFEVVPGKTPYTKESELQNAETSAWGRAIVAALAADTKRGIASREEVRNRSVPASGNGGVGEGSSAPEAGINPVIVESLEDLPALWTEALKVGLTERKALAVSTQMGLGVKSASELDVPQMRQVLLHWLEMKAKA